LESRVVYVGECPNCKGHIDDGRLLRGLACRKCLPKARERELTPRELLEALSEDRKLDLLKGHLEVERELEEFERLFEKAVGSPPWGAQKTWARRVLSRKSFSIIAPTGVGKTVFGLVLSLFLAAKGEKSYVVLPTTPLVLQAADKLYDMKVRVGSSARVLAIHARMKKGERGDALERIAKGEFDILITTSRFMIKNWKTLASIGFRFVFVDDVDAVLKSGRSILALLYTLGFDDDDIDRGQQAIMIRRRLASLLSGETVVERVEEIESLYGRLRELTKQIGKKRESLGVSLVVSSATGRPRGPRVLLFRELLGFQAGSRGEMLRKIKDAYYVVSSNETPERILVEIVRGLGRGGLVYVPVDKGVEYAEALAELLREQGIRAEAFHAKNQKALDRFVDREVDVLVGVAVYYGVMVRGLDLPWLVRYAVFVGVPRFKFSLSFEEPHPINVFRMLSILAEAAPEDERDKARAYMVNIRRILRRLSPAALQVLAQKLREGAAPEGDVERAFYGAASFIREALKKPKVVNALRLSPEIAIKEENGKLYIYIPDVMTYIQASGRTSRLYAGGLTQGLSVVIVDDERLFKSVVSRMKWYVEEAEWSDFKVLLRTGELERLLKAIDEDRRRVLMVLRGELKARVEDLVKTALLVVESPTKAKTIASFFGRPSTRIVNEALRAYEVSMGNLQLIVASSGGHVKDLVIDEGEGYRHAFKYDEFLYGVGIFFEGDKRPYSFLPFYTSIKKCQVCKHQTVESVETCPRCGSRLILDSARVIEALRELAIEADIVMIGTDPDTEGEKIGWDLASLLRPFARKIVRVEFHEVTRKAVLNALQNYRDLSKPLVEAQLVRRIEDRWIGFTLSPILWRSFWKDYCEKYIGDSETCEKENRNLSAGRVQTPVLGWIIERYNENRRNKKTFYRLKLANAREFELVVSEDELGGKLSKERLLGESVKIVEEAIVVEEIPPPPPYTTDSMLGEASRVLGLSAPRIMRLAQDLFELGLITYHRTDSTRVSDVGIAVARDYLVGLLGEKKAQKEFAPRRWGERGAHEAIRPTKPVDSIQLKNLILSGELELPRALTRDHFRLYDMIFRRFIASQMSKAVVRKQVLRVELPTGKEVERQQYTGVVEPGYLQVYLNIRIEKHVHPDTYRIVNVDARDVRVVPLYTQGDVVELMKKKGIGRPSTYATIISKLLTRGYVIESRKVKRLVPTKLGVEVYSYLTRNFEKMVSEERTRALEEKMDLIAEGKEEYNHVLRDLYEEISSILNLYPPKSRLSLVEE